jgi:hypothetical protein
MTNVPPPRIACSSKILLHAGEIGSSIPVRIVQDMNHRATEDTEKDRRWEIGE